ncbi:MAG: hypothetical protein MUP69_10435 [Candidatus Atribacteria bacterium]|nr:hypothetical protein [Candidatus Atribacteria bacterium]
MKRKFRMKIKVTENDIKSQVKDYLNLRRYFHFPLTAGMGSYSGLPDRIAIKNGKVYFIESKKPIGGKQSDDQIKFQKNIENEKGKYIMVKCLEDLIKVLEGGEKFE